ncbi:MAG: FHA domain-containing protein [Spirulina sp. SIO3F2]|nr:FHA domain-containing protein [Spirulina sp. SIO3F2]
MPELKLHLQIEDLDPKAIAIATPLFVVGRLEQCDLCLPLSDVSRQHCRIYQNSQAQWFIEDLGSTNGTFVNAMELKTAQLLMQGDVIEIGSTQLSVSLTDEVPVVQPAPPRVHQPQPKPKPSGLRKHTILQDAEDLKQQWLETGLSKAEQTPERRIARLEYLVEISKNLSSAESIEDIFGKVQAILFKEIDHMQRLALLVDVEGDRKLQVINSVTPFNGPDPQTDAWISRSICSQAFNKKIAIKTLDAQTDKRFEGKQSIVFREIEGVLAAPLWDTNQVVGVLYADVSVKAADSAEGGEDLSFFSTIANLVAYSVQRWLLHRRLQGQERIRQQLERYHSPAVVQQLINAGELAAGRIKPKEADISVIFVDLVGFSNMSERMTPQQVAHLLDRFFDEMLGFVFAQGGTLDKFIGDCIMAFFGAPEPQTNHADRAVRAGLSMLKHLEKLNMMNTFPEPLQIHVAISSGTAVVGDVGSSQRVDYTVLGQTVNLAARLEGICPANECLISEATYQQLSNKDAFIHSGEQSLKGFVQPLPIYRMRHRQTTVPHLTLGDNTLGMTTQHQS